MAERRNGMDRNMCHASWYKGNTHAHSNLSDGDFPPEKVIGWYESPPLRLPGVDRPQFCSTRPRRKAAPGCW